MIRFDTARLMAQMRHLQALIDAVALAPDDEVVYVILCLLLPLARREPFRFSSGDLHLGVFLFLARRLLIQGAWAGDLSTFDIAVAVWVSFSQCGKAFNCLLLRYLVRVRHNLRLKI